MQMGQQRLKQPNTGLKSLFQISSKNDWLQMSYAVFEEKIKK